MAYPSDSPDESFGRVAHVIKEGIVHVRIIRPPITVTGGAVATGKTVPMGNWS